MLTEKPMYEGITDSVRRLFPEALARGFAFPTLYFSDEEPREEKYGSLSDEEIREGLDRLQRRYMERYPNYREIAHRLLHPEAPWTIPDWLSGRNERETPITSAAELDPVERRILGDAKDLLSRRAVTLTIDASYDAAGNEIILYEKAHEGQADKEEWIRRTVAHEVFHALHSFLAPSTYKDGTYHADVVREALADFYAYLFCLDETAAGLDHVDKGRSASAARDRYCFWQRNIFSDIPYPNAIFCMYRNGGLCQDNTYVDCLKNGSKDRLKSILNISTSSMEAAYIVLVPELYRKNPAGRSACRGANVPDTPIRTRSSCRTTAWQILKKVIRENDIGSLEELAAFFPKGVITIIRGRFITLESGEILSAYPQWKITDWEGFRRFAQEKGYLPEDKKIIVEVSYGPTSICSYIYEPVDGESIEIGDTVRCYNANNRVIRKTVTGVRYLTEKEYREYCVNIGYPELSKAEKYTEADDYEISAPPLPEPAQQLIVMKAADASRLSDKELKKKLIPAAGKINRREDMVPLYIYKILKEQPEKKFKTNEICRLLEDFPYELEMESKSVRRALLSLAYYEEDIFKMEVGREWYFWYSEDGPEEGYITSDDYDDSYDDLKKDWE